MPARRAAPHHVKQTATAPVLPSNIKEQPRLHDTRQYNPCTKLVNARTAHHHPRHSAWKPNQLTSTRSGCNTCEFLLSCLTYRNVSSKVISKIVGRCQEDRMLPLVTWLFGLGLVRYLYLSQILRSLSGLDGDCVILEDAFQQQRRVPMSTCEHFSILKAFLEVHYQGRPGEPLVKIGQFNMTLGSRRGMAIRPSDWATKGLIRAESNVVMYIYVKTDESKCIACLPILEVTSMGKFFW